jgi:hypothetical protein
MLDTFHAIVQGIILKNPFGCIPYRTPGTSYPPVEVVREMYTAKFAYTDGRGKRVGAGSEIYNTIDGFHAGIAAIVSNIANIAAHGGAVIRNPDRDTYAVLLKCHDAGGELFFLNLARDRITLSSYRDDAIRTGLRTGQKVCRR